MNVDFGALRIVEIVLEKGLRDKILILEKEEGIQIRLSDDHIDAGPPMGTEMALYLVNHGLAHPNLIDNPSACILAAVPGQEGLED